MELSIVPEDDMVEAKNEKRRQFVKASVDGRKTRTSRTKGETLDRMPWSTLDPEIAEGPGGALLAWLFEEANRRGIQLQDLAKKLDCTYGYLAQLRTGRRKVYKISDEFADACADFLKVPRLAVLLASGKIRTTDFYEDPDALEPQLDNALRYIQNDTVWGPFLPADIWNASLGIKQFVVLAFEQVRDRRLVPSKVDPEEIVEAMEEYDAKGYIPHPPAGGEEDEAPEPKTPRVRKATPSKKKGT